MLLIYANVAFTASIDYHYCVGKIVDLKICGIDVKTGCPMTSMHPGCCKHQVHYCNGDSHESPSIVPLVTPGTSLKSPVFVIIDSYNFAVALPGKNQTVYPDIGEMFRRPACPLFISNRVFRI